MEEPIEFQDITLYDQETGEPFAFTAKEQAFYAKQGFTNVPKYTPERRKIKREQRADGKQFFNVKCMSCIKVGRVMQEPPYPRRILCGDCFDRDFSAHLEKHPELRALFADEEPTAVI